MYKPRTPLPVDWYRSEVAFSPEFQKLIQAARQNPFRETHKPIDAGTIRDVFKRIGLVDHLPKPILDTPVHLVSKRNLKSGAAAGTGYLQDGKQHIYLNAHIDPPGHVRRLVHEIQHVADRHSGQFPSMEGPTVVNSGEGKGRTQYRAQNHERRARRAQETGRIIVHILLLKNDAKK